LQLQSAGNWKSVKVATGYIRDSKATHKNIAHTMCGESSQSEDDNKEPPQPEHDTKAPSQPEHGPPSKILKLEFNAPVTGCTFIFGSN